MSRSHVGWDSRPAYPSTGLTVIEGENMRRYHHSRHGSSFFFSVVTHERRPILTPQLGRVCLRTAIGDVRRKHPFDITAIVLLPDHLHAIWELPRGDNNYSTRWRLIKRRFSKLWLAGDGAEGSVGESHLRKGERGLWQ